MNIYTASKVKHHINIFQEKKTMKFSKDEFILLSLLKRDFDSISIKVNDHATKSKLEG